jgi:acyl-CoA thioester hydrolase
MINKEDYKCSSPIHMRWNDLDSLGHVNNAIYVTYFEAARASFMAMACPDWDWTKHMFLIGNVNVDFKRELLLTATKPEVWMKTKEIGNKSFVIEYVIVSQKKDEYIIHAKGSTTQIMFDMKTRTTIQVEDWVRDGLTKLL